MTDAPFDQTVVFVTVADLDVATEFYRDGLGLPYVMQEAHCRFFRISQTGFVGLCQSSSGETKPSGVVLTLVTDDVDGVCAGLVERGIVLDHEPRRNDAFNIYHAFLKDPDGNLIEIQRFDQPEWPRDF
jgi:catechol 2,3-dioxygenase-like lactoylglutathione lyase family enzyme